MAEEAGIVAEQNEGISLSPQPSGEDVARQQGWKPQEEWEGDPEGWVDAKTFNQRGEYMERIKSQSSLIKKLEKKLSTVESTMNTLAEHHRKVKETERAKALEELKAMKVDALDMGDHSKVAEIDDQILDIKQAAKDEVKPKEPEVHPAVEAWVEENSWYKTDPILRGAADGLVRDIVEKNPSLQGNVEEVLAQATERLKEEFPNKFGRKQVRSAVLEGGNGDGVSTPRTTTNKYTARHLNTEQRKIAERFVRQGAVKSLEEYARQLADIGELDAQKGA